MTRPGDRPFDVEIGAAVSARRVRFGRVPDTDVRFRGRLGDGSGTHSARENLPEQVAPGVVYRDVRVRWHGGARVVAPDLMNEYERSREMDGDEIEESASGQ